MRFSGFTCASIVRFVVDLLVFGLSSAVAQLLFGPSLGWLVVFLLTIVFVCPRYASPAPFVLLVYGLLTHWAWSTVAHDLLSGAVCAIIILLAIGLLAIGLPETVCS